MPDKADCDTHRRAYVVDCQNPKQAMRVADALHDCLTKFRRVRLGVGYRFLGSMVSHDPHVSSVWLPCAYYISVLQLSEEDQASLMITPEERIIYGVKVCPERAAGPARTGL